MAFYVLPPFFGGKFDLIQLLGQIAHQNDPLEFDWNLHRQRFFSKIGSTAELLLFLPLYFSFEFDTISKFKKEEIKYLILCPSLGNLKTHITIIFIDLRLFASNRMQFILWRGCSRQPSTIRAPLWATACIFIPFFNAANIIEQPIMQSGLWYVIVFCFPGFASNSLFCG